MKQKTKKVFNFLQNSIKDSLSKFHYYECDKSGMHNGQKLTYVCINKHCQAKGLICSICRQDHTSHDVDVIPLKNLLSQISQLKDTLPKQYVQEQGTREYLETLEDKKNQLLYSLKQAVQQLALYFQNLEEEILAQFRQTKINLLNNIGSNRNLKNKIEEVLENINKDQKVFQKGIKQISSLVYKTGNKNQIDFNSNLPELINQYDTYSQQKTHQITQILNLHKSLFANGALSEISLSQKQGKQTQLKNKNNNFLEDPFFKDASESKIDNDSKLETKNIKQPTSYTFSTLLKRQIFQQTSNTILVEKNGSIAKQTKNGSAGRFVLVTEGVGLKKQQISFKITRLVHWIGIGICIRDKIIKGKYAFQYDKLGHGSYLLSSNGFTWSHSDANDNIKNQNFLFSEGQIIDVYLNDTELKFVNRLSQKSLKLKISMNKTQWSNVCFCVNLCDSEDKVQIVSSSS